MNYKYLSSPETHLLHGFGLYEITAGNTLTSASVNQQVFYRILVPQAGTSISTVGLDSRFPNISNKAVGQGVEIVGLFTSVTATAGPLYVYAGKLG